jgi:UDP-GlcNAc:undecaprenyl-phosphate GlcNAc-1-phosphate transferase
MMLSAVWFGLSVAACCSFAGPIGRFLGVIDYPDGGRKSHARPTPMIGGVALMVPLLLIALAAIGGGDVPLRVYASLVVAGLGFLVLGLYDDRQHTPPGARLLVATGLFGAVILLQPGLMLTSIDLGIVEVAMPHWVMSFGFTVVCLVGLQNSINMVDGMNGLLISLAMFWVGCLLLYAPDHLTIYLQLLLLGLAILLPYNLRGALFLGDAGSYSLGGIIGILMIYTHNHAGGDLPTVTVVLWLLVPVADCLRVMGVRLWHERSPLSADDNHLHHRLARHWRSPICLLIYVGLVVAPGALGALWPSATISMLVLSATAYGGLLWVTRVPIGARAHSSPHLI